MRGAPGKGGETPAKGGVPRGDAQCVCIQSGGAVGGHWVRQRQRGQRCRAWAGNVVPSKTKQFSVEKGGNQRSGERGARAPGWSGVTSEPLGGAQGLAGRLAHQAARAGARGAGRALLRAGGIRKRVCWARAAQLRALLAAVVALGAVLGSSGGDGGALLAARAQRAGARPQRAAVGAGLAAGAARRGRRAGLGAGSRGGGWWCIQDRRPSRALFTAAQCTPLPLPRWLTRGCTARRPAARSSRPGRSGRRRRRRRSTCRPGRSAGGRIRGWGVCGARAE